MPECSALHPFPLELVATLLAMRMASPLESVVDKPKAKSPATALMAETKRASPPIALTANVAQQALT